MDGHNSIIDDQVKVTATMKVDNPSALEQYSEEAEEAEHSLTVMQAVRLYRLSIFWALFFCIGQLMTSYNPQILGNMFAMPRFQRDFGYLYKGSYIVAAPWQTSLMIGSPIGQLVGALGAAYPLEWLGRKETFGACAIATMGCVAIQFSARSLLTLLVGEFLGGLVLGLFAVLTPTYASEVCPLTLRGIVTANLNLFLVVGQLLASSVCASSQRFTSHWAYSTPFATQWLWPVLILSLLRFAPESPWWLYRNRKIAETRQTLQKLVSSKVDIDLLLAIIAETSQVELEMESSSTYRDLFKKVNRRRTEICTCVYVIQVLSGIYLIWYSVYFFEQAGFPVGQAFYMGMGIFTVGILGNFLSWFILASFGRRSIYNRGLAALAVLQLLIGTLDCVPDQVDRPNVMWAQALILVLWNFLYNFTVGPVGFSVLCETSAMCIRGRTIAFATAVQAAVGIGMAITVPYMINPDQANLGGRLGFVFGGLAAVSFVWSYYRLPETKNRTYAEIDILFKLNVPARQFESYVILEN